MNITPESLVQEFKRSGHFDAIRKQVLEEFQKSKVGQDLASRFVEILEQETNSKIGLTMGRQSALIALLQRWFHLIIQLIS